MQVTCPHGIFKLTMEQMQLAIQHINEILHKPDGNRKTIEDELKVPFTILVGKEKINIERPSGQPTLLLVLAPLLESG